MLTRAVFVRCRSVRCAAGAQTLGLGGLAASRLAGILNDHPKGWLMRFLFAAEASAAVLGATALARGQERKVAELRAA